MKIRNPPKLTNRNSTVKYIEIDLWSWLRELSTGLQSINFQDNFISFMIENITIPAGQQVAISNQLTTIPTGRIITRQLGDANIIDGTTKWTNLFVYLQNPSLNDAIISVIFFK